MTPRLGFDTALLDVDGTLIDSNMAHAATWAQALRDHAVDASVDSIGPLIGMGADKLLPRTAHVSEDSNVGKSIAERKKVLFKQQLPQLQATRGARALVQFLLKHNVSLVIATSAGEKELHALLEQAGLADLIPLRTSKDDAGDSKPDPDVIHAALARADADPRTAVMIGDTPYDVEAAARAGVRAIALRSGKFWNDDALTGAVRIFNDPAALLRALRNGSARLASRTSLVNGARARAGG